MKPIKRNEAYEKLLVEEKTDNAVIGINNLIVNHSFEKEFVLTFEEIRDEVDSGNISYEESEISNEYLTYIVPTIYQSAGWKVVPVIGGLKFMDL